MGNKNTKNYSSLEDIINDINIELQNIPKNGYYLLSEFEKKFQNSEYLLILNKLVEINDIKAKIDALDSKYGSNYKIFKEYENNLEILNNEANDLCKEIPNPLATGNTDFWLKMYNIIICSKISSLKYNFMGKIIKNIPYFQKCEIFPENITFDQLNIWFNLHFETKTEVFVDIFQEYLNDEYKFTQKLLDNFYTTDHIFEGLNYNLNILDNYPDNIKDFFLTHILINNNPDFTGPFSYNDEDDYLKVPKNIEDSLQYKNINILEDFCTILNFIVNDKMNQMSFFQNPILIDYINRNQKYFEENKEKSIIDEQIKNQEKKAKNEEKQENLITREKIDIKISELNNKIKEIQEQIDISIDQIKIDELQLKISKIKTKIENVEKIIDKPEAQIYLSISSIQESLYQIEESLI